MRSSGAGTARVERARLALGYEWLTSGYLRTGYGWSGEQHAGGIRWVPLHPVSSRSTEIRWPSASNHRQQMT